MKQLNRALHADHSGQQSNTNRSNFITSEAKCFDWHNSGAEFDSSLRPKQKADGTGVGEEGGSVVQLPDVLYKQHSDYINTVTSHTHTHTRTHTTP